LTGLAWVNKVFLSIYISLGYGFVDFEHPQSAQTAVAALTAKGIQAQMAKVLKYLIIDTIDRQIDNNFILSYSI
jgi:hypothetical protein